MVWVCRTMRVIWCISFGILPRTHTHTHTRIQHTDIHQISEFSIQLVIINNTFCFLRLFSNSTLDVKVQYFYSLLTVKLCSLSFFLLSSLSSSSSFAKAMHDVILFTSILLSFTWMAFVCLGSSSRFVFLIRSREASSIYLFLITLHCN